MERKPQPVTADWLLKVLMGITAFFLTMTFITVQTTSKDVIELKQKMTYVQGQYNDLNVRVRQLETMNIKSNDHGILQNHPE